jgi:hypothetical protein
MILDELFKFPIIMTDRDNEEKKGTLYNNGGSADMVIGEAEYPYFGLVGLSDRWKLDEESFTRALEDGKFNACYATFNNVGTFLVPWTKEKFKTEYRKFVSTLKPKEQMVFIKPSKEDLQQALDEYDTGENNTEE